MYIRRLSAEGADNIDRSKKASSIVNLILPEVIRKETFTSQLIFLFFFKKKKIESFPSDILHETELKIIEVIKQSTNINLRLLDIFTKIWNALSAANETTELNSVFNGLINAEWGTQSIVGICSAINEMELSSKQLEQCIKYMIK